MDGILGHLYYVAILLETIERKISDSLLAKHQICQYFPMSKFALYGI